MDPAVVKCTLVALLVPLCGCDIVYSLDRPVPTVCGGEFRDARAVPFGDELTNIVDFSFNGPRTRGFVRATVEAASGVRTGPVPVFDDNGRWRYDATYEANWAVLADNDRIRVARMARDNELFVAQQQTTPSNALHAYHYGFVDPPKIWAPVELGEIARTSNTDSVPGGELAEPAGSNPPVTFDFLPIFRYDQVAAARSVAIALHAPNATTWEDQERVGGDLSTSAINAVHQPWSGALARTPEGRQVLIYAATSSDSIVDSDLYISEKRDGRFVEGVPLTNFNTDAEELEPWVSEDCSMITFRRTERDAPFDGEARSGGTIYMSTIE